MYPFCKIATKFTSGGLHEKHIAATWGLGNHLSIYFYTQENQENPVPRWPVAGLLQLLVSEFLCNECSKVLTSKRWTVILDCLSNPIETMHTASSTCRNTDTPVRYSNGLERVLWICNVLGYWLGDWLMDWLCSWVGDTMSVFELSQFTCHKIYRPKEERLHTQVKQSHCRLGHALRVAGSWAWGGC
jgi:hypothetical protein